MKKILITIILGIAGFVGWFFYEKPVPPFGADLPVIKTELELAEECIITKKLNECIGSLSAIEKNKIKGQEIAKIGSISKIKRGDYYIEILEINPIEKGIEVFAKAWDINNEQIGFGDGSVDIERFVFINPPILVPDPNGIIERIGESGGLPVTYKFREDIQEALLRDMENVLKVKTQKFGSGKIVQGKIGRTTTTIRPDADPESTTVDGHNSYFGNPYSTAHDATSGNGLIVSGASGTFIGNSCTGGCGTMQINRGHTLFDASSINAADTIDSAIITLTSNGDTQDGETACDDTEQLKQIILVSTSLVSNTNIENADYNKANFGATYYITPITINTLPSVDGNTQDFTVNAAGLSFITTSIDSVAGIIKFGWRNRADEANCTPATANSSFGIHYADEVGTTQDPVIVIGHTGGATEGHRRITED